MNKLVSIVVPVYNIESLVAACLDSLKQQTYEAIEVLIVDDGSQDRSREICLPYTNDSRFRYVYKENGGLSDARNEGIRQAKGEYIAFVDGDDIVDPQFIERLVCSIEENNTDIAVCSFYITNAALQDEQVVSVCATDGVANGKALLKQVFEADGYKLVVAWNKLYRRSIFDQLSFQVGKLHEDEYLNFELFYHFPSVSLVSAPLYHYVQRSGSIVHSEMTKKRLEDQQEYQVKRIAFYEEHKEKELLYLAKRMYGGWLARAVIRHSDLLTNAEQYAYQKEFRKHAMLLGHRGNLPLMVRDAIGYVSLKWLKGWIR